MQIGGCIVIKKMRSVRAIVFAAESRRDLCYESGSKGFHLNKHAITAKYISEKKKLGIDNQTLSPLEPISNKKLEAASRESLTS